MANTEWLQGAQEYGAALEDRSQTGVPIATESEINNTMSIPGVKYTDDPTTVTTAQPEKFVQLPLGMLFGKVNTAAASVTIALSDLTTLKQETAMARDGANAVNAVLSGMTVTITDRSGVSRSTDIGFEIYHTYVSVSVMNADAANVPQGKFVIIATTDTTSADNAKLYCKNSQGGFTFLSDLDQASSAAWADWLNNKKPAIEAATSAANTAATNANNKATAADTAATNANNKATIANTAAGTANTAASNANTKATYAQQQGDMAKEWNTHPPYIGNGTNGDLNYWYIYNITSHQYVKGAYAKGDDLDYSTNTEAERQQLIENVKASLVFASVATSESIIDELT
jgi:hypothetical protein